MAPFPHPDAELIRVGCAVITISDTRTQESDRSGQVLQALLTAAGHEVKVYRLIKDEPAQIKVELQALVGQVQAIIFNGGTGIAPRDTTYDAIASLLEKELPGFGELFRWLSFQEIGSRAIASRAVAGVIERTLVFSLPGSTNAVKLAAEKLILPELRHLTQQLAG